jgi:hypothetical protein
MWSSQQRSLLTMRRSLVATRSLTPQIQPFLDRLAHIRLGPHLEWRSGAAAKETEANGISRQIFDSSNLFRNRYRQTCPRNFPGSLQASGSKSRRLPLCG